MHRSRLAMEYDCGTIEITTQPDKGLQRVEIFIEDHGNRSYKLTLSANDAEMLSRQIGLTVVDVLG